MKSKISFYHVLSAALLATTIGCSTQPTNPDHPFRSDATAFRVESLDAVESFVSRGSPFLCLGVLAANAGWVVAEVISITDVLEAPIGVDASQADPAQYLELRVVQSITGDHPDVIVTRELCGMWPNNYGIPCTTPATVGATVIVGLQRVESNEGFPQALNSYMGVVRENGEVLFMNSARTTSIDDAAARIAAAYDVLSPIELVCHPGTDYLDLSRCPPEVMIPANGSHLYRSTGWCGAEPQRPWTDLNAPVVETDPDEAQAPDGGREPETR